MLDMQQKIKIFKALGNETRFLIFKNVFTGGYVCSIDDKKPKTKINPHATCVTTIAEHFEFSLPTISKHLQLLREAGVIKMQKKANKIYIEPNIETIKELGGCFTTLVENFEKNRELFFDTTLLK
ncbi:ArsR/SmtB family transcription factor [Sulfurimonas sp.]|jgi:ArsR family transcriptional regulator|uniref:ArsR/SmtB family transcription factor n=1 Tax=Sulfurimonas sp. TaxID=2022749 RepID=UPI003D107F8B